ncbi:MAG: CAP domain-containing protein [Candidatus Harrisonbacteria bacterium]|nr:CAP domain-containing protein [Candidatus Harrisonbacteria bacterium]
MKGVKKYLIAHKENDHRPHLLRKGGALFLIYLSVLLFFGAYVQSRISHDANFLSAILPAVLVDLANENRQENSLSNLAINPLLEQAARLKAEDMAKQGYFAHNSPEGLSPWYFFALAGYNYAYAGENLAMDFNDSEAVDDAWMASDGHRANILNADFSEIGIAAAEGMINGRKTTFVVQMFGRPRTGVVALAEPAAQESKAQTTPAPQEVIVESAQGTPEPEEVIAQSNTQNEMFIAVSAPDVASEVITQPAAENYSSFLRRTFSSPIRTLATLYALLSLLVLVSISSILMKEVKLHHIRHIAYGFASLLVMAGLLSIFYKLLFSEVLVV